MRMKQKELDEEAFRRANEDGTTTTPLTRTRSGKGYKPGSDAR